MGFCLSFPTIAADPAVQDRIAASVAHHAKAIGMRMRDAWWTNP